MQGSLLPHSIGSTVTGPAQTQGGKSTPVLRRESDKSCVAIFNQSHPDSGSVEGGGADLREISKERTGASTSLVMEGRLGMPRNPGNEDLLGWPL